MDERWLLGVFAQVMAKGLVDDPVVVEVLSGPVSGPRLAGVATWDGAGWRVVVNGSGSRDDLWHALCHEVGHLMLGHATKQVDPNHHIDRAMIAGGRGSLCAARMAGRVTHLDRELEVAADAAAGVLEQVYRPALDAYLLKMGVRDG